MRRSIVAAVALFLLTAILVTGCDDAKPTEPAGKPAPPSQEVKVKGGKGGGHLVKDSLDALPKPVQKK